MKNKLEKLHDQSTKEVAEDFDELISTHIKPLQSSLSRASIEYFLKTGTINGDFRHALHDLLRAHDKICHQAYSNDTPSLHQTDSMGVKLDKANSLLEELDTILTGISTDPITDNFTLDEMASYNAFVTNCGLISTRFDSFF